MTAKKKTFYSVMQENKVQSKDRNILYGIVGLVRHNGFEVTVAENTFNVYEDEHNQIFIIDPETGLADFCYYDFSDLPNMERIQKAADNFAESRAFKEWQKLREQPCYGIAKELFTTCLKAEALRDKLNTEYSRMV